MKRLIIIMLLLLAVPAHAVTVLTTPIVKPDIDRYQVTKFVMDVGEYPIVTIELRLGYDDGGFKLVQTDIIKITNKDILRNNRSVYRDDEAGLMLALPAAYQESPASKVIEETVGGTFGGQATLLPYIEVIVKTIFGL